MAKKPFDADAPQYIIVGPTYYTNMPCAPIVEQQRASEKGGERDESGSLVNPESLMYAQVGPEPRISRFTKLFHILSCHMLDGSRYTGALIDVYLRDYYTLF